MQNKDDEVIEGFGDEWSRFPQDKVNPFELKGMFEQYFRIFPWDSVGVDSIGADIGCGSGRWIPFVASRVGTVHAVDASAPALVVAQRHCQALSNVVFHHATTDELPFADCSLDFAYSLGVLHHIPDTAQAIRAIAAKLKPGAPLLLYLYYRFDNRPWHFAALWRLTDLMRRVVSNLPLGLRYRVSQVLAGLLYWPLARTARLLEWMGRDVSGFPLNFYRDKSFYTMRTDALDRFGTKLEQRFTRSEIATMLVESGFTPPEFSDEAPFWCAVSKRI